MTVVRPRSAHPRDTRADIVYPDSDGMPIAESDFQRKPLMYAVDALETYFADRPDVYVSGNIFVYYEEGNPKAVVAPDVLVVLGAERRDRRSYFVWHEPKAPDWILEVTSRATRREDTGAKARLYARLGVTEYFRFDPTGDYLDPPLQAGRLAGGRYEAIAGAHTPAGALSLPSAVLGLDVRLDGGQLGFFRPRTDETLLTYAEADRARREAERARREAEQARREAEARATREAEARAAAEARVAELEARLAALEGRASEG